MAHLHKQETNDERNRIKKEETNQGLGVTIEIHPPARKTVYNSIHNVEDEIDDKAKVETKRQDTDKEKHQESPEKERGKTKMKDQTSDSEVTEHKKRRKMPTKSHNVTELRNAIKALKDSDDTSESDNYLGSKRRKKRVKLQDSDQAQLEIQLGQSLSTDSSAKSENRSDSDSQDSTLRTPRTPIIKRRRTRAEVEGGSGVSFPLEREKRKDSDGKAKPKQTGHYSTSWRERYRGKYLGNRHMHLWPAVMVPIGFADNPHSAMTSERAIRMVEAHAKERGLKSFEKYAAFFARLFIPDTLANLRLGCQRYTTVMATTTEAVASHPTCDAKVPKMEGVPTVIQDLVKAYIAADNREETYGVFVGIALNFYHQALFGQEHARIRTQVNKMEGKPWGFILK
ncbi:MAG: hypothetical protein Q9221_006706 [Calogaya cf. arnoldii]